MVGTIPTVDASTVTKIHTRLAAAGTSRFLTVDGAGRCVRINVGALAELVTTLLHEQTKDLRAECAALAHVSDVREREIVELIGQRDAAEARVRELTDETDRLGTLLGADGRSWRGA